jgi:uncharacterized membrane protein
MANGIVAAVIGMFIGGLLGGSRSGLAGVIFGGCCGYLLIAMGGLRQRLDLLQKEVEQLRKQRLAAPELKAKVSEPPPGAAMEATDRSDDEILDLVDCVDESYVPGRRESRPASSASTSFKPDRQQIPANRERLAYVSSPPPMTEATKSPLPEWLGRLLSGENLLVKLGVVILFFGVAFLVKYAAQHGFFPLELRLTAAALGGCVLLAVGWRLRAKRPVYAQVIQGGGVGILYLTTFAAMRLYHLIPTVAGFALLVAICLIAGLLAILQDAQPMAVLGAAGGFLAPELASIGSGSHVMLFAYYLLLNSGVIAIACFRAWRSLNLLGFFCTFVVGAAWGGRFYQSEHFATVEPFLILFFLCYTAVPILYARLQPEERKDYLDATIVFGAPIAAFLLQAALVQRIEYGLAWSAFALGIFYLGLALILLRKAPLTMRLFAEAFLAFGTVFATLAIPLAFDGRWTAAAWSMEGAGMVWAGLRQERRLVRGFGYLLLAGSGVAFLGEIGLPRGAWPVLNGFYCGCLLISMSALVSACFLERHTDGVELWETWIRNFLFAWGMAWWFAAGLNEITLHALPAWINGSYLAFIALSCGACALLHLRLNWRLPDLAAMGLLPAMVAFSAWLLITGEGHPSGQGCLLAWPLAFAVWYAVLKSGEERRPRLHAIFHAAPLWLMATLIAWELNWQITSRSAPMETWALTAWGVVPALLTLLIVSFGKRLSWPVARHLEAYFGWGCGPLALACWLWMLAVNLTRAGNPWPLTYMPILNPMDAASILILVTLGSFYLKIPSALPDLAAEIRHPLLRAAFGATIFIWLNAMLLRTIHHWAGVAFTPHGLFASQLVQTSIAIFWSLTALVIMTIATRRSLRPFWIAGATLLGGVVAKLFLVDLASQGTVARIVSFVAVGILLLVIGWFAPVPPTRGKGDAS